MNQQRYALKNLKSISILLLLLLLTVKVGLMAQTRLSDEQAKQKYATCRKLFDEKKYLDCYKDCISLTEQMGKKTRKVQWLMVNSGVHTFDFFEFVAVSPDITQRQTKHYNTLSLLQKQIKEMMSFAKDTETDNYWQATIKEWDSTLSIQVNNLSYQKNRTPQSAINFLNECAEKFRKKMDDAYYSHLITYVFSLEGGIVTVKMSGERFESRRVKPLNAAGELQIPLKEVQLENQLIKRQKKAISFFYPFYSDPNEVKRNNSMFVADSLPVIVCKKDKLSYENDVYCNHIRLKSTVLFNKSMKKVMSNLQKSNLLSTRYPIQVFQFFNEDDEEFKRGAYHQKIEETFRYLIESQS